MVNFAVFAMAITAITPACTGSVTTRFGGFGDAAGHVQTDHQQALRADFADRRFDVAAHQRPGQHQGACARQAGHGANGVGQSLLAHQRYGVDGDVFAANVMAVGFANSRPTRPGRLARRRP